MSTYKEAPTSDDSQQGYALHPECPEYSSVQEYHPQQEYPLLNEKPSDQGYPQRQKKTKRYENTQIQYVAPRQGYSPNQNSPNQGYAPNQGYSPNQGYVQVPVQQNYTAHHGDTQVVIIPGQVLRTEPPPPPDHMCCALLACLFCFLPLGVVAILKAYQAMDDYKRGNYNQANANAKWAKHLSLASLILGVIMYVAIAISKMRYLF